MTTIDVDRFIQTMTGKQEAPVLKLYDREWVLAPELPLVVRLLFAKATSPDDELTALDEERVLVALLGQDQYDALLLEGLTASGATALILAAMGAYAGQDVNNMNMGTDEKEDAPGPKARKKTSTKK